MLIKTLLFMLVASMSLSASDSNATYNFDLTLVGTLSVQGNLIVNGGTVPGLPATELVVTTGTLSGPFMFNSLTAALASITDASATKPYTVRVGPGPFIEDSIVMKSFVNVIGDSIFGSIIQANNASNNIIIGANNSCIEHCYLKGATGSGAAAVYFHAPGNFFILDCRFGANNIIAQLDAPVAAANALTVARCFIDTNSNFTTAFVVNGSSTTSCIMTVANCSWAASAAQPSLQNFASITGPNATFLGASIAAGAVPESSLVVGGNGFKISNTGKLVLSSVLLQGFTNAFYVPSTGGGPNIQAVGILGLNNTTDLNITHTSTGGAMDATLSYAKSSIATGAPISLFLTDPISGNTVSTGGLLNTEELDVYGAVTAHSSLDITGSVRAIDIATRTLAGSTVLVSADGQLGIPTSSMRFKKDIQDLANVAKLDALRPVSFVYKNDATNALTYGLLAEEVAQIYPELVMNKDGQAHTVMYHQLPTLLLAGYKQQQQELKKQKELNQQQTDTMQAILNRLKKLEKNNLMDA